MGAVGGDALPFFSSLPGLVFLFIEQTFECRGGEDGSDA